MMAKHAEVESATHGPLTEEQLGLMDCYWRAANYLSVGQIYLKDNPLLERPLTLDDVKPRLLGHWGTTPGLNFLYVGLVQRDLSAHRAKRRRPQTAVQAIQLALRNSQPRGTGNTRFDS
jgi:phosphoketolase